MGIHVDLYNAFDTVNHDIFVYKLYNYGVRGSMLPWFKDYSKQATVCFTLQR